MAGWLASPPRVSGFARGLCLAVALLPSVGAMSLAEDGGRRSEHAVAEDDLYKSPVQLLLSRDGRRLFVACENSHEVLVVDTAKRTVTHRIAVGPRPFGLAVDPQERRLYVTSRGDDSVSEIDLAQLRVLRSVRVGDDPHQLVVDASGRYLYVASTGTNDVLVLERASLTESLRLASGTTPFGLAPTPDGAHLFVSHMLSKPVPFRAPPVLELAMIDLNSRTVVERRPLEATVAGQSVAVSPDGRLVVVALALPKNLLPETQIQQGWMVTHGFGVSEVRPGGRTAYFLLDEPHRYFADPFGLAFSPDGEALYVSSSGADSLSIVSVSKLRDLLQLQGGRIQASEETLETYARHLGLSSELVQARIPTGRNPKAVAVSPDGRFVYVANRLSDSVLVVDARSRRASGEIDLGGPRIETALRKGERLFNGSGISFQGQMSCNTCHPEYHLDGLLYDIVAPNDGVGRDLVDNRTVRGIAFTEPFKWNGKNPTLERQEGPRAAQLFFRSHGFEAQELAAIVRFVESLSLPPNRFLGDDGRLTVTQEEGRRLFERGRTADGRYIAVANRCPACHYPPAYTDHKSHDVGTRSLLDSQAELDTVQLGNVNDGPPFLHDGRCYSLEEIWTVHNPDDLHGETNDMDKRQLNAMVEYMKTLGFGPRLSDADLVARLTAEAQAALDVGGAGAEAGPVTGYAGNQACAGCHVREYLTWLGTRHARAFVALQKRQALEAALGTGSGRWDHASKGRCLACHATNGGAAPGAQSAGFQIEEGVQCEACHGPGAEHSATAVAGRADARVGMPRPKPRDACGGCHGREAMHGDPAPAAFDRAAAWEKIRH